MTHPMAISDPLMRLKSIGNRGFAIALHIHFTTPRCLFQAYPKEWIELYSQRGYVMHDPTVRWGFENTGRIRWSDLSDLDEGGVLKEAAAYDLNFGACFAMDGDLGRSIASVVRDDRDLTDDELDKAEAAIGDLHAMTASQMDLSAEEIEKLRQISILFTHP